MWRKTTWACLKSLGLQRNTWGFGFFLSPYFPNVKMRKQMMSNTWFFNQSLLHIGNVMVSVLILFQVFCLHILPNTITKIISVCFVCRVTVSLLEFCEHLLLVIGGLSDRALWSQGNVITRLSNIRCRNGDLICRQLFALCNYTLL